MKRIIASLAITLTISFGTTVDEGIKAYENKDYKTALSIFEDLASKNNAAAQVYLGALLWNGDVVKQDLIKAKEWFEKAAAQGNANAQYFLGDTYRIGIITRNNPSYISLKQYQDSQKAKEWLEKAAAQNKSHAQHELGVMYSKGEGIKQDKKVAKEWFRKACDNKVQKSCRIYKMLNEQGY